MTRGKEEGSVEEDLFALLLKCLYVSCVSCECGMCGAG